MNWQDFENSARELKEMETSVLIGKAALASQAAEGKAARALAHIWGCSKQQVDLLARIWDELGKKMIWPDVPLSIYRAALDAGDGDNGRPARYWLQRALRSGWSSRQLRDAADISRGRHVSRVSFRGRCPVAQWDVPTDTLTVTGLGISGEPPEEVEVTVREVLQSG